MRPFVLLLMGFLVGGCVPRADQVFVVQGQIFTGSSGAIPGYEIKLVRGKQGENEAVGDDGSICRLTRERFQRTKAGNWLACNWTIAPEPGSGSG